MDEYAVLFEKEDNGTWSAHVPDLPGCHSIGDTLEEAQENVKEAIEGYIESLRAHGDPVPQPAIHVGTVKVSKSA